MNSPLLTLSHISKIYQMDGVSFKALDDISLTIEAGEYTAIRGPSGSGKSTLMHIMGCLDTPSTGLVRLKGKDISKLSEEERAKIRNQKIGFIFQEFNLMSKTTALANVELPLVYAHVSAQERKRKAVQELEAVDLGEKQDNYPSQLSGGQKQRVAIARALVADPEILLADEPTGNLDSQSGREILGIFDQLSAQGRTIIVITHDSLIAHRASRIISIKDGKITQDTKRHE